MKEYILSCGSTVDLTEERLAKIGVPYISYKYFVDGEEYDDNFGNSMSYKDFYNKMRQGADTKTTQINSLEYIDYFKKFLEQGKDVLHIEMSSGISGSYNSALIAQKELQTRFPNQKLVIIDSLCISSGYGMLVETLAEYKTKGMSFDDLAKKAEELKLKVIHLCTASDLTHFVKGGRISKTAGIFGSILKICPFIKTDEKGALMVVKKIPGKSRVIDEIVRQMERRVDDGLEYNGKCYICNGDCIEDAQTLKRAIEAKFVNLKGKIEIFNIGTTIGSHTGPSTFAVFFFGHDNT